MPDKEVETIQYLIFYQQYAKIIARSAFKSGDGKEAKRANYGFIKKTFRELKNGDKSCSDITREDWQFIQPEKRCIYCGSPDNLEQEHIIPKSVSIKPECKACERILGIHNQIYACSACNGDRGKWDKGLYTFFKLSHPGVRACPALLEQPASFRDSQRGNKPHYPSQKGGACPPEDCGGVWGYEDLLAAIRDPNHEQHNEMLEWAGEDFDPEAFDLAGANKAFAKMRRERRI